MKSHYGLKFPEEIELENKQAEFARLQSDRSLQIKGLQQLKIELRSFEKHYDQVIGKRVAELDKLEAQISGAPESSDATAAKPGSDTEGEWSGHLHASDIIDEDDAESTLDITKKSLKALYREVAKSIHPDLAATEYERSRRQELMAEANRAYKDEDRKSLLNILKDWEHGPEKIRGKDIGAELVKVIRLIAKEREELLAIDAKLEELKSTDTYIFKRRVEDAAAKGIDLLAEMAATIDLNIANARKRLSVMKGMEPFETTLQSLETRILCFPPDHSCGTLYLRKRSSNNYCDWQKLSLAKGARTLPSNMAVRLDVRGDAMSDLSFLRQLQSDDLDSLFLYDVNDTALGCIDHLTGLEELYISDSSITDEGLWKLTSLYNLMRIYLYHTDVTDSGLFALFSLKKLTQFTCSGTLITDTGLENLQIAIPGVKTLNFPWRYGRKSH